MSVCLHVCIVIHAFLKPLKARSAETKITCSCELPHECWELTMGLVQGTALLLTC